MPYNGKNNNKPITIFVNVKVVAISTQWLLIYGLAEFKNATAKKEYVSITFATTVDKLGAIHQASHLSRIFWNTWTSIKVPIPYAHALARPILKANPNWFFSKKTINIDITIANGKAR